MQENTSFNDFQDTIPENTLTEENDIDTASQEIITPNDENVLGEDIIRDTELPSAQNFVSENTTAPQPFITVQYNHKNRDFTKEEAVQFIQKGMHTEALRSKLEYLAKTQGTDVNAIVEKMITAPEEAYKNYLERLYGKDSREVEIGMQIYREKQSKEYKDIITASEKQKAQENTNMRLADEYLYLKQQIPNAPEYSKLPDSVIIEASGGKRDLFSAYLCYLHKEQTKIEAAKKTQQAAQNASAGTMNRGNGDNISPMEMGFLNGLWSK